MNKKGFIMHPATWIIIAFLLGFTVCWLIAINVIPLSIQICPK